MPDKIILGTIDRVENDVTVLNQENINEIIRQIFDNQVKLANYLSNLQSRYDNIESYIKTKIDEGIGTAINTEITNQIIAGVNGLHYAGVIDENKSEVHNYYRGLADSENNSPSNNIIDENVRGAFVAGEGNVGTNHFQVITGRYAEINERALVAHGVGYSDDEEKEFKNKLNEVISIVNNNAHERIVIYMVKHVNKEEFENLIKQEKIVVVDFFAVWCGPCQMLTPVLEDLSNELTEIDVLKIDIDEEQELAISMGIEVVPTVMVFKNGEKQKVLEGLRSKSEFIEEIEKL